MKFLAMRPFGHIAAVVAIAAGAWSQGPPSPIARSELAVATLGRRIYVIGGYAPAGPSPTALDATGNVDVDQRLVQVFDVDTQTWSLAAPLPRGMNHVGAVGFNGRVYTFGGFVKQNRDAVADANVYDPGTNQWTALAPLPRALGSISVAVLDGKIHLVGGRDIHSVTTHEVYDPVTNRYTSAAPIPVGRDHMGLVAYDGKLYAIAGRIDDFNHNTSYVDIYDPKINAWASGAQMPSQRSGMAVALYRNLIFAIGGEHAGGAFTNNEAYNPRTNTWSSYPALPEGRHGTGAAVIDDKLYIPMGAPINGGSRQTNTLDIFIL
jgi:hypothetical protein